MSDTDKLKGTTSLDLESSTTNEDRGTQIKKRFNFWTAVGIAVCTSGAVSLSYILNFPSSGLSLTPSSGKDGRLPLHRASWEEVP